MLNIKKHKKSYAILLVNAILLLIAIFLFRETDQVLKTDREERQLTKINLHIDSVLISIKDAQRGSSGYVISGDRAYLKSFYNTKKNINQLVNGLELALNTQKDVQRQFIASERLMAKTLEKLDETISLKNEGVGLDRLAQKDREAKLFVDTLQNIIMSIEKYEKERLDYDAQKALADLQEMVIILVVSGIIIIAMVVLLSTSLVKDILKREELSLELEGSEKRYHFLFELSADGIVVSDLKGIITDCNSAACKLFGYTQQELIGQSYHLFFPEDQRALLPRKVNRDTVTGDKLVERTYVRRDGALISAEVYTKLIEINGLSNVVAHVRDVTDKKQAQIAIKKSEEKYRNLFERSLAGIFRTTVDGKIIECNDEYARVLGYKSADDIKNTSTKNIYADPADREKLVALLKKEGEVKDLVMKLKRKDGSYVWVYDSVAMLYDDVLQKDILFGTLVDITAQKEAESEIRMLAHSLESISECVSITDANNVFLHVNESFTKTYGFKKEELVGQHISIIQPRSIGSPGIQKVILDVTNKGGWKGELINKRKNGSEFPVYLSTSIVKDSQNNPVALVGVATDITAQKQAEQVRKEREESLKEAQTIGKMGSWEYDIVNQKTIWSDNLFSIYGLGPYEIEPTYEYFRSRIHPDDQHLIDEAYERTMRYKVPSEFEMRVIFPSGDFKWMLDKIVPIFENDNLIKVKGVNIDITEHKKAEEEIVRLNRVYAVLSNINETIVRIKDKRQLLGNACKIAIADGKFKMSWIGLIDEQNGELKVAAAEGLIDGYLDDVIFADKNYPQGVKPVLEILNTGKALIFNNIENLESNTFWRAPALKRGYKSNAVFPLKVFGKVIGNFSLFSDQVGFFEEKEVRLIEELSEDISFALETMEIEKKRKESESLFLTLANISPVGIFRTRADGYTTYVNPKWCQLSNMSAEEAIGDGWLKAVHPDDRKWLSDGWNSATDKKRSSVTEYRFLRPDGSVAWVMGQAIPERNTEGQIEGYVGTITDITKIKLYEQELIKAKQAAEESDKLKSEFLAQISHEIRTPMNVMISSADYLKDELEGLINKELISSFYAIDAAGKRIIRTVDLILNMADMQTHTYNFTPAELNLSGQFLTTIYNEFITAAKQKNLEFNFHRKTMEAHIHADEYSLRQIIIHLLDNAIKYTNKGKVELILDKTSDSGVTVSVTDTGIGMSKEFMNIMYEPFTQEEQGYSRRFEGNGLGLALVKKCCDLNDATISVESEKEKGTVFTVTFNS